MALKSEIPNEQNNGVVNFMNEVTVVSLLSLAVVLCGLYLAVKLDISSIVIHRRHV
jgi:uncharacterized Tic20 family protein